MNIELEKLEEKHIIALTGIGLLVVIYLFYTFIFVPQTAGIEQLTIQRQQEQQKVRQVEAFEAAHPNTEEYLKELDNKKLTADTMLPDDADMKSFLVQAEAASMGGKLPLLRVKYGAIVNQKGFREIPVDMAVSGDYFQTLNFIKNMEQSPRFNSIKKIVMKLNKGMIDTEITSSIFIYGIPAGDNKTPGNGQK